VAIPRDAPQNAVLSFAMHGKSSVRLADRLWRWGIVVT